ncbi:MAG TPA: hypothetical protein PK733_17200 [Clostridiales bacterium]|nr:hypothetical protein [Clostridiales bacterium]
MIQKAWKNVLFNQFHDIMGGCSIKEAYDDAGEFYGESFPVNITDTAAVYEIPYGHIERPANGEEEPGQQWVDVFGTVLKSDSHMDYMDHFGKRDEFCEFMDQGIHEFGYVLVPHKDNWKESGIVRKAFEFNTRFPNIIEKYHKGVLSQSLSGICILKENIVAVVFKREEDEGAYILRCYETCAKNTEATIEIPLLNRRWKTSFGACEIKTFRIPDDLNKPIEETSLLEY